MIDMGIDFAGAQKESEEAQAPATASIYTLQITDVEEGTNKAGGPRLAYKLEIVACADPKLNGKKMMFFTNTTGPGVGFLTEMLEKFKCPWKGTSFDERAPIGKQAKANVTISDDGKCNTIQSWV